MPRAGGALHWDRPRPPGPWLCRTPVCTRSARQQIPLPPPGAIIPSKFSTEVEGGFVVFFLGAYIEPWWWMWAWRDVLAAGRGLNAMIK